MPGNPDECRLGGVHAGYNWQTGPWVLSVEGDVDFIGHIKSTKSLLI